MADLGGAQPGGQRKKFVLPEDDAPSECQPEPTAGATETRRDASQVGPQRQSKPDHTREEQAANPLAAGNHPESANTPQAAAKTAPAEATAAVAAIGQQDVAQNAAATGAGKWWQAAQAAQTPQGQAVAAGKDATQADADASQADGKFPAALAAKLNAQTQTPQAKAATQTTSGSQPQTIAAQAADAKDTTKAGPQSPAQQANQAQTANAATKQTSAGTANTSAAGNTGTDATESGTATAGESQPTDQTARTHARGAGDSLTGLAQHNAAQAAADKPTAEVDANLQAQAKLTEHTAHATSVRPADDDATQSNDARMAHATATLAEAGRTHHAAETDGAQQADAAADRPRPAEQIIESVRQAVRDGQRELTINLNPPELGRVRLKMYAEGDAVTGRIEVENTHTLHEIRQQAELLIERLTADGITFRRLEVHQMGSTNSQTSSYSSTQQDASGQNAFSQGRQGEPSGARGRLMPEPAATAPARSVAATGAAQSGAGSLNVWI